jgi:opacity protein-like surface antigen
MGGNHQLRYGVAYEDISFTRDTEYSGNPVKVADGRTTLTGTPVQIRTGGGVTYYRATRGKLSPAGPTLQKYYNAFIQDTWQMGHLTVRPGIRWERQHLTGIDPSLMAFPCHTDDPRPGETTGTGATIPCTYTWNNLWAPRIGATYDIKGDGRAKVFASFGRFFTKIPNDLAARAMSADAGISRADYFDSNLTQPVPNGVLAGKVTNHYLLAGAGASQIDPNSKSSYQQEAMGGLEFAVGRNMNVGLRYIHRTIPRILEDYQPAPIVAFDLGCPGATSVEYFIANISPALPKFNCAGVPTASFEDPVHKYDSVEFTVNKTFSDNWSLMLSYRWSKLSGLYEGAFRNDNGQSDPSITSLFDFPTNDPSYSQIGVPQFGYRGDIRYQGCTLGCGVLPNDRTNQVKAYASYAFSNLNAGIGINVGNGIPLTNLAANPNYGNSGEIPVTVKGGGIQTVSDGFLKRAPMDFSVDLHLDYTVKVGKSQRMILAADAFNLLNRQSATWYDYFSDQGFGSADNPNYGYPLNGGGSVNPSYAAPFALRLGARFEW